MRFKTKLKIFLIILVIFLLWYFFIYKPRLKKQKLSEMNISGSGQQHILWGHPVCENDMIFEYEGFVSGYDTIKLNPRWVSYNLKKEYLKGQKFLKERKFAPDPSLDKDLQAANGDYTKSGYDRGHLARQADMKGRSRKCELESCYFTNISPQKQDFNRETWNNLERAVDDLTLRHDESWIVTGPYFDDEIDLLKKRVEIPDGFYKIAILRKGKNFHPLAFVLDMESQSTDLEKYTVTIDSVESLTGIDFFHELADSLENPFESKLLPIPYGWK